MPNTNVSAPEVAQAMIGNGFSVVPLPRREKGPRIPEWQNKTFVETDFRPSHGIGIKTGDGVVALDIDVYDAAIVEKVVAEFVRRFGITLRRTGHAPKTALLIRCPVPKKVVVKLKPTGHAPVDDNGNVKSEQIEVLTDGQQLVAFGIHPGTGKPYSWHDKEPWVEGNTATTVLPSASLTELEDFLNWIEVEYGNPLPSVPTPSVIVSDSFDLLAGYVEPNVVAEGGRNDAVLRYVGHIRGKGTPESLVLNAALNFNTAKCRPPLDTAEVERIVATYSAQGHPDAVDWPEPQALGETLPPAPIFDFEMLPDVLVDFVRDVSERMGVPPDYVAVPSMLAAAAALGSGWAICPKAHDKGWKETAVLWGGIVAPPGSKKSPCLQIAAKPLQLIEAKLAARYESDRGAYLLRKKAAKNDPAALMALVEPKPERATVHDVTYQKLAEICSTSPNGVMAQWDEIAGMVKGWNANGQEAARGFYLTAWSGDQPYIVDRKEGGTMRIDRLFIVISGGVQPSILGSLVRDAKQNGASNDGLIQRFQMMVCPDAASAPAEVDRAANIAAQDRAWRAIERLRDIKPAVINVEEEHKTGRGILHFSEDAQTMFNEVRARIEGKVRQSSTDPMLASHFSKLPGAVAKLAMLIHLLDGGTHQVSYSAMFKAAMWANYLRRHAERLYELTQVSTNTGAARILEEIKAGVLSDGFTAYAITRKGWKDLNKDWLVEEALSELIKAGWLRPVSGAGEGGGRPTIRYIVNPKVLEG